MTILDSRIPRVLLAAALGLAVTGVVGGGRAGAAPPSVGLGTATSFAVLASSTVTNTGPTVISGDLGVSPGTAVTGFDPITGPGTVTNGTIHTANAVALQAQNDLTTAYNDAAGRTPTGTVTANLAGQTLVAGVYRGSTLDLSGALPLTLDAQGDPDAVFIFQAGSTLITASASRVLLINGATPCNVFWQVGSSATLGTNSTFVGSILAQASVGALTGATVAGRLLARTAAVTLDTNRVTAPTCAVLPTTTTTAVPETTSTTATTTTTAPATTATTTAPDATATTVPPTATTVPPTATTVPPTATTSAGPTTPVAIPAAGAAGRGRSPRGAGTAVTTSRGGGGGSSTATGTGTGTGTGVPDLAVTGPTYLLTLTMAGLLALCAGGLLLLQSTSTLLADGVGRRGRP